MDDAALVWILRCKGIQFGPAQYIFFWTIPIQNHTWCIITLILHDGTKNLKYRGDTAAATDHVKWLRLALFAAYSYSALAQVLELANWTFEFDPRTHG